MYEGPTSDCHRVGAVSNQRLWSLKPHKICNPQTLSFKNLKLYARALKAVTQTPCNRSIQPLEPAQAGDSLCTRKSTASTSSEPSACMVSKQGFAYWGLVGNKEIDHEGITVCNHL